jgi:2-polyprenyl-6-methoxyphenol hydroxylase-like FAD-dependent oxidoreductase
VTRESFPLRAVGETWGSGERFGITALPDGRVYWFAVADKTANESKDVPTGLKGWHEPIPALLDATDPDAVLRNDIIELAAPLPSFVDGRVALVGDAAHAMTPNLGQGGNLALEDAVTLARLVTDPDDVAAALVRYDAERLARTASIARQSRRVGRVAQLAGPAVPLRNLLLRLTPGWVMARSYERLQAWRPPPAGRKPSRMPPSRGR